MAYTGNNSAVRVADFGAVSDGSTDDTTAIQNALNSGAKLVLLGDNHVISKRLTVPGNVTVRGNGRQGTLLKQTSLGDGHFGTAGSEVMIEAMHLVYSGTPSDGAISINITQSNTRLGDLMIDGCGTGIQIQDSAAIFMHDIDIYTYNSAGILATRSNDIYLRSFIFNAGVNAPNMGKLGGIRLVEHVEAFVATDGDILGGAYSMTMDASNNTVAQRPAYNRFTNVYFDSAYYGSRLDKTVETTFTGCWWSGGREGNVAGLLLAAVDSLVFQGCEFFNNGLHGCEVSSAAKRTIFSGCKFESNSVNANNVGQGIYFRANCTDFLVKDCIAHNGLYGGVQAYGIAVEAGASNRYVIRDNLVSGNGVGGVSDSGSGTSKNVVSNW